MATWQKELVDFYGYDNLQRFVAGQGDEWGEEQDFQTGRVAMTIDGEWRTSENFMGDPPAVPYMTAPFPVPDDSADKYGMGQVGGTIIGIPKGSPHPEDAWLLVSMDGDRHGHLGLHGEHRAERAHDLRRRCVA